MAGNTVLSDSYAEIIRALSTASPAERTSVASDALKTSDGLVPFGPRPLPQLLQQAPDAALLNILLSVVSTTVGDEALELPWKCFACVVSMCMLVPLATNLALQVCVLHAWCLRPSVCP